MTTTQQPKINQNATKTHRFLVHPCSGIEYTPPATSPKNESNYVDLPNLTAYRPLATNPQTQEAAASSGRELQEALAARDEAIGASENASALVKAAEGEASRQEARAATAEEKLTGYVMYV